MDDASSRSSGLNRRPKIPPEIRYVIPAPESSIGRATAGQQGCVASSATGDGAPLSCGPSIVQPDMSDRNPRRSEFFELSEEGWVAFRIRFHFDNHGRDPLTDGKAIV